MDSFPAEWLPLGGRGEAANKYNTQPQTYLWLGNIFKMGALGYYSFAPSRPKPVFCELDFSCSNLTWTLTELTDNVVRQPQLVSVTLTISQIKCHSQFANWTQSRQQVQDTCWRRNSLIFLQTVYEQRRRIGDRGGHGQGPAPPPAALAPNNLPNLPQMPPAAARPPSIPEMPPRQVDAPQHRPMMQPPPPQQPFDHGPFKVVEHGSPQTTFPPQNVCFFVFVEINRFVA